MTNEQKSGVDLFRDTPVRYLGYANEVGESFRAIVDKKLVLLSYGVSSGYVVADTVSKGWKTWRETSDPPAKLKSAAVTSLDVLLWQSFASVIIPGYTINRICAGTRWIVKKSGFFPYRVVKNVKWIGVFSGLASIPFIIHPIDRAVDRVMDATVRPLYEKPVKG